jgi:polyisoprenyl-phosphate glycosyltransferase
MKITIIIPVYNEEGIIEELYQRTTHAINKLTDAWEIICINDGSHDLTLSKLIRIHQTDKRWKIVSLSKNFGHQHAIWAGLDYATGDYVGIMDGDLQDNPEAFQQFFNEIESGYDVVYAIREKRKEGLFRTTAYWLFYRILRYFFQVNLPLDSGDFCLMKKQVVQEMLKMPEQGLFIRGLRNWIGFNQKGIYCERARRLNGYSKYSFRKLLKLASNGLFSFSDFPIRLMGTLGVIAITISILYSVYILSKRLLWGDVPQGFTTLIIVMLFFGGVQLLSIRILGEYIHRIYNESRKRPLYVIQSKYGLDYPN